MTLDMPLRDSASDRNLRKFPDGLRSHIASSSLEGPRWSRYTRRLRADSFPVFSAFVSWRRCHVATCPDVISVCWCISHVAAPHTDGGALAVPATSAAT